MLSTTINEVNENFEIGVTGIPWPTHLRYQRANMYPLHITGWMEDYHDPHNWYPTYLYGTFGSYLNIPEDKVAEFQALVEAGVKEPDFDEKAVIYAELDQMIFDYAPYILGALATNRHYEQNWVEGYYYNPIASGFYFYPLSKSASASNPTTFTELTIGEPETLDPALAYETAGGEIIDNVYEGLIQYDREKPSTFVPALAAEMPAISDDGLTYTFKIREGITFHNGNDLTPSDVAYSLVRGMLQGYEWVSPQWMITEAFFDATDVHYLVDDEVRDTQEALLEADPAALVAACEQIKSVIVADDAAGTVTMTLPRPWPLLPILGHSLGSIMDEQWVVENGGWDGSCDTWQNFYAPESETHTFTEIMNGTGPFEFESWDHATQTVTLTGNADYWRTEEVGPAWEGGPTGAPSIERVIVAGVDEWGTRFAQFQAGDGEFVVIPKEYQSQVDPLVSEYYEWDDAANAHVESTLDAFQEYLTELGLTTEVGDGSGSFRVFVGHSGLSRTDVFINQMITNPEDGGNPFLGSGVADGNGIPSDFFANEHVRKAFNYCFDWDTYIADVLSGEAVQAVSTELPGMPGWSADAPHYTFDLEKCAEEFQAATMMLCE
jgi:peptide/nickel transport system substrate-binding protein